MTEIEALKKTVILWDYIAAHPWCSKTHAYRVLGLSYDSFLCPLCAYVTEPLNEDGEPPAVNSRICPLIAFWPDRRCRSLESPYEEWLKYGTSKPARKIADAARAKLKELKHAFI